MWVRPSLEHPFFLTALVRAWAWAAAQSAGNGEHTRERKEFAGIGRRVHLLWRVC